MPSKDYKTRLKNLRAYCDAKRGRRSALARSLGVTAMLVTRWLRGIGMVTTKEWIAIEKVMQELEE